MRPSPNPLFNCPAYYRSLRAHISGEGAMNVEDLMNLDRPMTLEEQAFFEEELLKKAREAHAAIMAICAGVGAEHRAAADKLRGSARRMLENVEAAVALPLSEDEPRDA
jgi:hypothetical protein